MANYLVQVSDNGDGSYTLSGVFRAPTNLGSGSTNLTPTRSGGDAVGKTTGWTGNLGGFVGNVGEVLSKAIPIVEADTALNGR